MPQHHTELENALRMFSRFFDLIHQPLAIIDREGKYVYYNQESADIDGYSIRQALGRPMLNVYPGMQASESTMLTTLKTGEEFIGSYQIYYNALGRAVDYQHSTAPLYASDGSTIGAIEIGRDMSAVRRLQQQVVELNHLLYAGDQNSPHRIITQDPGLLAQIAKCRRLALNNVPVVIAGETGTGKELFARLIHQSSPRAEQPFIALNCGALPPTLIESTLFGTVKGAFTGAENSKGYLELANGGTLFLDELNAMPVEIQSKLLRFLQDKSYRRLGSSQQMHSDARIVAALNESPDRLLAEKRLRADLFYRLEVGSVVLPPLAARLDDIPLLARHFIDKYRDDMLHDIQGISEAACASLRQHRWPGNVRMLENVIVRSMIMQEHDGPLSTLTYDDHWQLPENTLPAVARIPDDRPEPVKWQAQPGDFASQVAGFERQLIEGALNGNNGCVSRSARQLGLSRTTLQYKMQKYGIRLGVVEE